MHASVHMFIEFVCIRVFKGEKKENVPNLYSLDGPLFMYPLPWDKKKKGNVLFMYPPRSTSYYVGCRRVVLVQTQQHRETAALMKR